MVTNVAAPFCFRQIKGTGSSPTYEQVPMAIASTNATASHHGHAGAGGALGEPEGGSSALGGRVPGGP